MKFKIQNLKFKIKDNFQMKTLIEILLKNRGIKTRKEIQEFLNPKLENVAIENVGIDKKQLKKAISRIRLAIKNKEKIVIYGDYDVDGISGTAILWETLNSIGAKVMPYIPHRIEEGYGLSIGGIENCKLKIANCSLIITVDNGIVANKPVDYANKQGIDVIITDHHVSSKKLPDALAIVHTTMLCGTGVAWLLAQQLIINNEELKIKNEGHLELVALATVADLVPLKGANRTLLKFGLEVLRKTKRIGLLELFKEAEIDQSEIGVYEIGHIIVPRLNATGRLDYAMDSLRLLCTKNKKRAEILAKEIGATNKERQLLTINTAQHAIESVKSKSELKKLLFVAHESYQQGVIGLVAGKLVEEFYRPAIVISKGKKYSKASARSVKGFDIIEFIRTAQEFLVDAGGHPMAAGFTIETIKLPLLQKALEDKAELMLNKDLLTRNLRIDSELPLSLININLYESLQKLAPFGMGNPEPIFVSSCIIEDIRLVGAEGKHLKLAVRDKKLEVKFEGIGFGLGDRANELHIGDKINITYTIDENEWNGEKHLQLKIKDIIKS